MQKNISNLKRKLEESGTKFLDLKYASLTGAMHHITVPLNRFEAPTYTDFAVGSRKTAVRLPKYLKNNKMMEIEYRIPDATANPYLATSAIVLAGIDGIERIDSK